MSEIKVDTLTGKTTANDITVTVGATATQSLVVQRHTPSIRVQSGLARHGLTMSGH